LIRIPHAQSSKAVRIELRSPDSSCNPYLAFALMLKAGLEGIKSKIQAPEPIEENVYVLNKKERKTKKIECLPDSLQKAFELTEKSSFVKDVLGEHLFSKFIENKKRHIQEYQNSFKNKKQEQEYKTKISPYEIERLLPIL
jgi:glutamine synthetase